MQTMTIEGDLHVAGAATFGEARGLPFNIIVTGELRLFTNAKPARGAFIDGPLIVQGDLVALNAEPEAGELTK